MFRLLFVLIPAVLSAGDWTLFRYGPYEVITEKSEKEARQMLNHLEQLRHTLATLLGVQEVQSVWPIRIVVLDRKGEQPYPAVRLGRDAMVASARQVSPETTASVAKGLLDSWPGYIPPNIERGLVALLSTLDVDGTRVMLGAVPAAKDRDWSRAHMLAVHPEYSGKLRVLLGNISRGIDTDVAYGNAFGKTAQEIEAELDKYIAAGNFGTTPVSGKPINADRHFRPREVEEAVGRIALADVLFAHGSPAAAAAYQAVLKSHAQSVEAREGLGLIQNDMEQLAEAKSARALLLKASLAKDLEQKQALLQAATKANPKWAEPHKQLAAIESHPAQKLAALKAATQLDSRDSGSWIALARTQEANKQFADAAKSWTSAERASDDPTLRAQVREARSASEDLRVEQQIAAREAARRKAEQELQDLRNRALLDIRKAEARANEGKPVIDPKTLEEYKTDPATKTIKGTLQRVDCLGGPARLHVAQGRKMIRIYVPDGEIVEIVGGGERAFTCGVQKPVRHLTIEYREKNDPKQLTVGEAVKIEFR